MNIQPNLTKSSGSCDTSSALLKLSTDAEKTNLTFVFTLVTDFICPSPCIVPCKLNCFLLMYFLKQLLGGVFNLDVFSLQNTTSNKYHLSEVYLIATLPDVKGMQTLNLCLVTMPVFVLSGSSVPVKYLGQKLSLLCRRNCHLNAVPDDGA